MSRTGEQADGQEARRVEFAIAAIAAKLRQVHDSVDPGMAEGHSREANRQMLALVEAGVSGAELGRRVGLSRERVRQRLNAARGERRRQQAGGSHRGDSDDSHPPATSGLLRPAEAAEMLGLQHKALRTIAVNGGIECIKLPSGHRRYLRDSVLAWAREHPRGESDE